jgi:hypothetical protein
MNPSTANAPAFDDFEFPYPILSPYASEQVHEHYGNALALNGPALQMQPKDGWATPSQSHVARSFDPSLALYTHAANNAGFFGDTQTTPTIPMGPPTRLRKRKAPTLRHTHAANNAGSFGDTQTTPTIPMGPPTRPRKRKAPTLRASDWEPYKARIVELHITKKRPLQEVRKAIKMEFGFTAEYVSFKVEQGRLLVF